jgi:uncharacterized protein (DUF1330 family)
MAAFVVFTREKTRDAEHLAAYSKAAGGAAAGHKVKALAVYGKHEVLEGPALEGAVLLEFPTVEEAKAWYNSPAYTEARAHRFKGADYRVFIVQGL